MNKVLITGGSSGLGKYLCKKFKTEKFNRDVFSCCQDQYDTIIHCGWNNSKFVDNKTYLYDAISLVRHLLKLKHRLFVFISSTDVYPKDNKFHSEDEKINMNDVQGIYALTKLLVEQEIKQLPHYMILRVGALLGKNMRYNNVIKLINGEPINISLKSCFSFIRYKQILQFIKTRQTGTFNLVAQNNIDLFTLTNAYGYIELNNQFIYDCGKICGDKACKICPQLKKTALQNFQKFKDKDLKWVKKT